MITSYLQYITEKINIKKININYTDILSSINAKEVNIYDILKIPKNFYKDKFTLSFMSNNIEFANSLASIGLKKSKIQNSDDFQTFIDTSIKWMCIYYINDNELDDPVYIIIESWDADREEWQTPKMYKINGMFKSFYDKLSSKTIELIDNNKNYIYTTSDGNTWELQNVDNKNKIYKVSFTRDELNKLLKDNKNIKVDLI